MMIEKIKVQGLRNLQTVQLDLHPHLNVFLGQNGSGKTSFLEAFYLLSRGQSFRSRSASPLIQFQQAQLICRARSFAEDDLVIEKNQRGQTKFFINEKKCQRLSDLSRILPCQIFHQDVFHILEAGSEQRRRLLDWGLYYQSSAYAQAWQIYRRLLMQRNMVLKNQGSSQDLKIWTEPLLEQAQVLTQFRQDYMQVLSQQFMAKLRALDIQIDCQMKFFNGWDKHAQNLSLADVFQQQEFLDRKHQYTHAGPHQADILFLTANAKAKLEWSRGQQKLILILLKITQTELLQQPCLFLMDDIQAELDRHSQDKLYQSYHNLSGQVMMTALDDTQQSSSFFKGSRWFYLDQGQVVKIVDC